ncbi:MAG: GlcNAc-PI de-N-acetylase, partial [Chloroflexi bacterium]|nr:GlcNAc-PI de-N-acetylase [Chloroflexota bacterium]
MKKILLAVVAHPDDETFGMGGTLAYYANTGVDVYLICATRGEVGEVDPSMLEDFQTVGELREHELCCAADELGLRKVLFLNYRDSGMPGSPENQHKNALVQAPVEEVARQIAALMREIKPQVVLTFDPIGGYKHPDHIAVHNAAVMAFEMAGNENIKLGTLPPFQSDMLYFHIFPRGFMKLVVKFMPLFGQDPTRFGKNKDIDLASIMAHDFPTHVRVNYRKVADKRDRASSCHKSQGGDRQSGYLVTWLMRLFSSSESFMR